MHSLQVGLWNSRAIFESLAKISVLTVVVIGNGVIEFLIRLKIDNDHEHIHRRYLTTIRPISDAENSHTRIRDSQAPCPEKWRGRKTNIRSMVYLVRVSSTFSIIASAVSIQLMD